MKKYLALTAVAALASSVLAMSNPPADEKADMKDKACAVKDACCSTDGSCCKEKAGDCADKKEACTKDGACKTDSMKEKCEGGTCPLTK